MCSHNELERDGEWYYCKECGVRVVTLVFVSKEEYRVIMEGEYETPEIQMVGG